jgi:hypothetical protein
LGVVWLFFFFFFFGFGGGGLAATHYQKKGDLGEAKPPQTPPPRKSCY